jgi:cell division protein ZapA
MKQLEVTIMGQSYILGCPEGGETSLLEAVGSVDREMCAIRDSGKIKARERIAVLAALNLAYALAQQPVTAAASAQGKKTAQTHADHDVDIAALIRRIDDTLSVDGQLI